MKARKRVVRLSYFAPAWFLGRHSSMYVERYGSSTTRRPRPSDDGAANVIQSEPR